MSFKKIFFYLKFLLFPFAWLYGGIIYLRHWLYNINFFKSTKFNLPIISIGNLSVGGTGKSPMIIYLTSILQHQYKVALISRGYKRVTKGFVIANENSTALQIGDEPLLFNTILQNKVIVAVGENRVQAVQSLLQQKPTTQIVLLDDAMQHRAIVPSFSIMLTECSSLYCNDNLLPVGNLRDVKQRATSANVIIVSKCSINMQQNERKKIIQLLPKWKPVFFTNIVYNDLFHFFTNDKLQLQNNTSILLVTGIAKPIYIENYLTTFSTSISKIQYPDHYAFTQNDLINIEKKWQQLQNKNAIIIITQKDAMRLLPFKNDVKHLPIYILPITISFLFNEAEKFNNLVKEHLQSFT